MKLPPATIAKCSFAHLARLSLRKGYYQMIVTVLEILVGGFVAVFVTVFITLVGLAMLTSPPRSRPVAANKSSNATVNL